MLGLLDASEHEQVIFCKDDRAGLRAIIAVHSTVLGPAVGGTRMRPYASTEDALRDVLLLSRAMTYKCAAAGLSYGGGKAVIVGDPARGKTEVMLRSFGRFIETLGGRFITGEDVGMTEEDMLAIRRETRWVVGLPPAYGGGGSTAGPTARGMMAGIRAAARVELGAETLKGLKFAIQGVGQVGSELAAQIVSEGASVYISDIDRGRVESVRKATGATAVDPSSIHAVKADFFCPCALGGVLNDSTIPELKCSIVAGCANNQLADEERHSQMLADRAITYVVDYVINAGGVIGGVNELTGYDRDRVNHQVDRIYDSVTWILKTAREFGITTLEAARRLVEERLRAERNVSPIQIG
ncbi:MAG: leucine dehydrogenase, partial [Firmicutes bacterium]|nr:leucine dehydrogenase [Bacillota bacterium]